MRDFCGTWLLNHDGSAGRFVIEETGEPESADYGLAARFTDADGLSHPVEGLNVESHKITFIVTLAGLGQLFRGYLFTGSRDAMAGYTIRGDERFGWFAIRADSPLVST
jgi:hypothetical protein